MTDAEEAERAENGYSRSSVQKRIDRLTETKYKLRQENQALRQVTEDLQTALIRALAVIDKLRGRKKCQMNSK